MLGGRLRRNGERMNKENIPENLHSIIPIVDKYGIGDDIEREKVINEQSKEQLVEIVRQLIIKEIDLQKWLFGPEMERTPSTAEYVSFTNFIMAIDSAKIKLDKKFDCTLNESEIRWEYFEKEINKVILDNRIDIVLIPNWEPVGIDIGLHWLKATVYEGYYIKYRIKKNSSQQIVLELLNWEYGEEEPEFA